MSSVRFVRMLSGIPYTLPSTGIYVFELQAIGLTLVKYLAYILY
jgi:hypothetical protein